MLLFFMAFFRFPVFAGTKGAAQIKEVSKGLLPLHYLQFGECSSDLAIIKIHTELVCTALVRHWYLFGVCPEKSISC